jgi:menaquinone-9 beta-reductase
MLPIKTDVLIAGGSIAGCIAAILFARKGVAVRVIDKVNNVNAYKVACTHFIQPSAVPILKELDLYDSILEAGGVENKVQVWTESGWIKSVGPYCSMGIVPEYSLNIKRSILDPLLRNAMLKHENIDFVMDKKVVAVGYSDKEKNQASSYICKDSYGHEHRYLATLPVSADGRFSQIAKFTENPEQELPNNRFCIFAYFKDLTLKSEKQSQYWLINPDMAYTFPLKDSTLVCIIAHKQGWGKWKENIEENFYSTIAGLNNGPDLSTATRISPFHQMLEMTNRLRKPSHRGIAFIGDSAMAVDPASGVGCGFAIQSAYWLAEKMIPALRKCTEEINHALGEYAIQHSNMLMPHAVGICADSMGHLATPAMMSFYREVAKDAELTEMFLALIGRIISPTAFQTGLIKRLQAINTISDGVNIKPEHKSTPGGAI